MNRILFCLLFGLLINNSCNKGSQDKGINDPGTERDLNKTEISLVKSFCKSITQRRKVITSSKINDQIQLTIKKNECDNQDLETQSFTAIYDKDLSGKLYFQSAGDLCTKVVWTDEIEPLTSYCDAINNGEKSDRIKIDLSLYVFDLKKENGQTLSNIYEYSMDVNDNNSTTFQAGHQLYTNTTSSSNSYGRVFKYRLEEKCTNSSLIISCEQTFD